MKQTLKNLKLQIERILARPIYSTPYNISYSRSKLLKQVEPEYDLVFVVFGFARDWILEAICREMAAYFSFKYCFHYTETCLPPAKAYFIAHYSFLPACLKLNPHIWKSKILVWYTHPREDLGISNDELIYVLNKATNVICMCSQFAQMLVKQGVKASKVSYIVGAADPQMFLPHQRLNGAVGFCTAFYYRKEPERIFKIIKMMPHRKFVLLGKNWLKYERFSEMQALPNFTYVEAPYSDYPLYYAQMDVYVSPSKLEGGPIPLIEAMMCNVVPVATNTGFAPDLIVPGENGFIFDLDSPVEEICQLIDKAFQLQANVRKTVEHLSWEYFALEIQKIL